MRTIIVFNKVHFTIQWEQLMIAPTTRAKLVFGLACNIERTTETESGFRARLTHPQSKEELFGQPRLAGFAELLKIRFAEKLIILGRQEDGENYHQSEAICKIIEMDYDTETSRAVPADSGYGTAEAADYIKKIMTEMRLSPQDVAVSTSGYHLMRVQVQLQERGVFLRLFPAEAFLLLGRSSGKLLDSRHTRELGDAFGGGPYAARSVSEIVGIAKMIGGLYKPQGTC